MAPKKRAAETDEFESDGGNVSKKAKQSNDKSKVNTAVQIDDDGKPYWELSNRRRLQISEFKDMQLVNIREFYEKDGKSLPGKKGISLSTEQFAAMVEILPQIEKALKGKGINIPRPQYDGAPSTEVAEDDEDEAVEEDADESETISKARNKLGKFSHKASQKANHEETSDESS